jgi:hypothetical protein
MTVLYGTGPTFKAQCPRSVIPSGFRYWNDVTDGPIPSELVARARLLSDDLGLPLGTTESYPLNGTTALLVVEPHPYTHNNKGETVEGCFHSAGVYVPAHEKCPDGQLWYEGIQQCVTPKAETTAGSSKLVSFLFLASLITGLAINIPALIRGHK